MDTAPSRAESVAEPEQSYPIGKARVLFYCIAFVAFQLACLAFLIFLASTPWFLTQYPGMYQSGYSLRLSHADCAVVIYGDSSALTGLDPEIVEHITGLKTCNVSEGGTIQGVVGSNFPLDTYLQHNQPPRFLLMMFTPSIFRPYRPPFEEYQPEGVIYALHYRNDAHLWIKLLTRPQWAIKFSIWAGHLLLSNFAGHNLFFANTDKPVDTRAQRDGRHGIWPYPIPPQTDCTRTSYTADQVQRYADSVAAMRTRYSSQATTVLINIPPVPTCDAVFEAYKKQSEGLHDNLFERLPIRYFNEGDVHFSPEGAEYLSVQAGRQILALENR